MDRLKALVNDRLDAIAAELDGLRREISAQEVRYKTGEYTEAQYRNATADARRRSASLERLQQSFNSLLQAETEADARHTTSRPSSVVGVASPAAMKRMARGEAAQVDDALSGVKQEASHVRDAATRARAAAPRKKGLSAIPAPKWMLIGSGVLIAAGAIAVVILLLQAVGGAVNLPGLPSLSGLFQRGGGATPPATSAPTIPPATVTPGAATAPVGAEFQVPVQLRGAQGVGSLYLELTYDAAAVEIVRFDFAALPANTLTDHQLGPGTVAIGVVTANGLTGDWSIAFITCRRAPGAAMSGDTTITISDVAVHRAADLAEVQADGANGHVNMATLVVAAPTVTLG